MIRPIPLALLLCVCGLQQGAIPPALLSVSPASSSQAGDSLQVDTLRHGRFGPVVLYRRQTHPSRVVLFVSGDGRWNPGMVAVAKELAAMDALVVGIDVRRYLYALERARERCAHPAADFESLSQWIQQRLGFPAYVTPVLVGYSSGASLVHATLAQSPPGTFRGGLSLGSGSGLFLDRRPCHGRGRLSAPWIALHGFGTTPHWMPQFRAAFAQLTEALPRASVALTPGVQDLPLVEVGAHNRNDELGVVISGDGGWAGIDRQIGETFAAGGIPVVGLNSLQYFWRARTPDQAAADLTRVLRHYLQAWGASKVLLVGYSQGADVLPFMVTRLPPDLRRRIEVVALLGLSTEAGFEFHFADLLGRPQRTGLPTVPEVRRLRGLRLLCVHGADETDSACPDLPPDLATVVAVAGGHHFGGAYRDLARRVLQLAHGK